MRKHTVVNERYEVIDKIGEGSFGSVYVVRDAQQDGETLLAMKVEKKCHTRRTMLQYEHRVYSMLHPSDRLCRVYAYTTNELQNIMVMELLGDSLEARFLKCNRKIKHTTALWLMRQIVECIQAVHSKFFVHRDIKPHNFVVSDSPPYVKIIDFGLAKQYRTRNLEHMECKRDKKITGTVRYTSINVHRGIEPSRRDDLESAVYILVYLINGRLPWQGIVADSKEAKYKQIGQVKMGQTSETLCAGCPHDVCVLYNYIKGIGFAAKPDYAYITTVLDAFLERENFADDTPPMGGCRWEGGSGSDLFFFLIWAQRFVDLRNTR